MKARGGWSRAAGGAWQYLKYPAFNQLVWMEQRYKLWGCRPAKGEGMLFHLFDIEKDPAETRDLSREMPDTAKRMQAALDTWTASVQASTGPGEINCAAPAQ